MVAIHNVLLLVTLSHLLPFKLRFSQPGLFKPSMLHVHSLPDQMWTLPSERFISRDFKYQLFPQSTSKQEAYQLNKKKSQNKSQKARPVSSKPSQNKTTRLIRNSWAKIEPRANPLLLPIRILINILRIILLPLRILLAPLIILLRAILELIRLLLLFLNPFFYIFILFNVARIVELILRIIFERFRRRKHEHKKRHEEVIKVITLKEEEDEIVQLLLPRYHHHHLKLKKHEVGPRINGKVVTSRLGQNFAVENLLSTGRRDFMEFPSGQLMSSTELLSIANRPLTPFNLDLLLANNRIIQ